MPVINISREAYQVLLRGQSEDGNSMAIYFDRFLSKMQEYERLEAKLKAESERLQAELKEEQERLKAKSERLEAKLKAESERLQAKLKEQSNPRKLTEDEKYSIVKSLKMDARQGVLQRLKEMGL